MKRPEWLDDDTFDFFRLLKKHDVRYLIIGGMAVVYYGYTRNTNDADIFYEQSEDNVARLFECLSEFWGGSVPGIKSKRELLEEETFFQFGREPNRIDLMGSIPGIEFENAWENRVVDSLEAEPRISINFISRQDLIRAKEEAGRPIDLADLEYLRKAE